MPTFSQNLAIESWVLLSIGLFLITCRMVARKIQLKSFSKFQLDDYIMLFTTFTYTAVIVSTNEVANNGSNYLAPGAAELLTPEEVVSAVYGSKMSLVLEQVNLFTLWQVKACMLLLYSRLTLGLRERVAVKALGWYCLLGFLVTQILYLGVWCRPIYQYWAVPVKDEQCATYVHHMITMSTFNISSDLLMLAIPLPLLIKAKFPLKRKLVLCGIFSLGVFVILASVLNRYFNFTISYSPIWLNWYVGEVSTAVYVANIPLCWPLVRRIFHLDDWATKHSKRTNDSGSNPNSKYFSRRARADDTTQGRSHRLHSDLGSEVEITGHTGQTSMSWEENQSREDLRLDPMAKVMNCETRVVGGRGELEDGKRAREMESDNIVKTVHVSQYSS